MNTSSNTYVARNFRKYFYIFAFCTITLLRQYVDAVPIYRCPEQCECSANENNLLTAKCGVPVSWSGIAYTNVSRFELLRNDHPTTVCSVPRDLWRIFPRLSSFVSSRCRLSHIFNDTFRNLDELEEVDLSHNLLKTIDRFSFATNGKLKFVNLGDNPLRLNRNTTSLIVSSSLWELDLSECNVNALSKHVFAGLPNLRYLTLSSNKIAAIGPNVLPIGVRTLNLAQNRITNVPIGEFKRLENLKEVDLSSNPINCTCELIGLQENDSGNGIVLVNSIKCAYPRRYAGKRLAFLSQYELCDDVIASSDGENSIFNRRSQRSTLETDGMIIDLTDDWQRDNPNEFIGFRSGELVKRSPSVLEGSGDGDNDDDGTASPDVQKSSSSSMSNTETETVTPSGDSPSTNTKSSNDDGTSSQSSTSVENSSASSDTTETMVGTEPSSSTVPLLPPPTTTTTTFHSSAEQNKMSPSGTEVSNVRYIIPTLLIVVVVLVCLSVYISQHSCRKKWNEEVPKSGTGMTEMQLLPDNSDDPLKPNDCSAKYPNEENKEQTEKLISNGDTAIEIIAAVAAAADSNKNTEGNGALSSITIDNTDDSKSSARIVNENARRKFFQIR